MKTTYAGILTILFLLSAVHGANFLDIFRRKPAANKPASSPAGNLSAEEISGGLKQALSNGVERAISLLGKEGGFLNDARVRIPMPQSLERVETTLRSLGQGRMADEFVTTMNRAAERAVPEAAAVLGESLRQMSITDASTILTGTNNAATQYFRRTSETNLFERFFPIVQKATEQTGVTSAYKRMTARVSSGFGGLGGSLLGIQETDLDKYVTQRALDGLFLKIAEQEKLIRENPAARATELLRKVFGTLGK